MGKGEGPKDWEVGELLTMGTKRGSGGVGGGWDTGWVHGEELGVGGGADGLL